MSLEIHQECQKQLIQQLADALPAIMVYKGKVLDYESAKPLSKLNSTLPRKGPLRDALARFIGERLGGHPKPANEGHLKTGQ
jgi:hypothetical protein